MTSRRLLAGFQQIGWETSRRLSGRGPLAAGDGEADAGGRDEQRHGGDVEPLQAILEGFDIEAEVAAFLAQLLAGVGLLLVDLLERLLLLGRQDDLGDVALLLDLEVVQLGLEVLKPLVERLDLRLVGDARLALHLLHHREGAAQRGAAADRDQVGVTRRLLNQVLHEG